MCYEPDYRKISSTVYSYHNGLIKKGLPYERKSVGFERVASRMGDGTYARNDYIQTGLSFPGRMAYHYEFSSERQTISRKYYTYLEETPYSGVKWIKTDSELSHDYESGVAVSNILREYGYDEGDSGCYGNVTSIAMSVNGNDGLYTEISYSPNQSDWIINRVISVKKWENSSCANLISWSSFGYDNYGWGGNIKTKADYLKEGTSWRAIERNFGYDDYGNITSLSFPNGTGGNSSVITNTYDEDYHTFPVEEISSNDSGTELKTITTYDYATGNKTSVTDANGNTTVYEYDDYGRIVAEKAPGDDWTKQYLYSKEYFPAPYSVVESRFKDDSSLGYSWKREYYDGLKRVVKTESKGYNGHALVQEFSYNLLGRLESKTNQYLSGCDTPQKTEYEYDSAGRPQKAEAPDSTVKRTEYSYAGNLKVLREIDADGNASLSKYDAQGRLRYQVDPSGGTITYNYDALGRLISTVDAGGNVTSIAYDTLGRKTSITDPNTGTTSFTYYDSGDVKTQTNARGVTLTYTYDSLNRITSESSSDGTVRAEYVYDSGTTNNLKGRLYGVDDNSGSTVFSYDARGNVTHTLRSIDSDGDGVEDREFAASFAYDSQKRLVETAYPDANHLVVKRVYGEAGNLHAVTDESGNAFVQYRRSGSTATAMNGHSISRMTGNGVETVVDFNPANMRPVTLETKRGNDVLEQMNYTFRPGGNILSITDGCTSDGDDSESFVYDNLGRLVQASSASSMYGTRIYTYGAQGNIETVQYTSNTGLVYSYGNSSHPHAVSSIMSAPYNMPYGSYSYDSTGNMTYRNGKTLVYDAKNRLIEVRSGANLVESYVYDFTGARIIKKLADGSAVFSINGMHDLKTTPGFPDQYVNYITGAEGDLAAQIEGVNTAAGASVYPVVKNMYNWKSPAGLMLTINAYASAWLNNPANYRRLGYALFGLLLAACSFVLFYSVRRYKAARSANACSMLPWSWLRHSVPGILLFFVFTSFGLTGCFDGSVDNTTLSNVKYMHPNHVGSVAMVTDHEGTVVARYKYEPYGKVLAQSTGTGISDYKYTSQKSDATGLYYYNARYYDPDIGRFITADTEIPDVKNSQAFNRYMYVVGNPVNYADPSGHWGFGWLKDLAGSAWSYTQSGLKTAYKYTIGWMYDNVIKPTGHWFKDVGSEIGSTFQNWQDVVGCVATAFFIALSIYIVCTTPVGFMLIVCTVIGAIVGGTHGNLFSASAWKNWDWAGAGIGAAEGFAVGVVGQMIPDYGSIPFLTKYTGISALQAAFYMMVGNGIYNYAKTNQVWLEWDTNTDNLSNKSSNKLSNIKIENGIDENVDYNSLSDLKKSLSLVHFINAFYSER